MKKIRMFLFLLFLCGTGFSDSLIDFMGVPFNADVNMTVKILKDKGFNISNIDLYKREYTDLYNFRLIVDFTSDKKIKYHTLDIKTVSVYFENNLFDYIVLFADCPDYKDFEESLYEKYTYLEFTLDKSYDGKQPTYTDKFSKASIAPVINYQYRYLRNDPGIVVFISKG